MDIYRPLLAFFSGDPIKVMASVAFLVAVCLLLLVLKVTRKKSDPPEISGEFTPQWYQRAEGHFKQGHTNVSEITALKLQFDSLRKGLDAMMVDFKDYRESHAEESQEGYTRLAKVEQGGWDTRETVKRIEEKLDRLLQSTYDQRSEPRRKA